MAAVAVVVIILHVRCFIVVVNIVAGCCLSELRHERVNTRDVLCQPVIVRFAFHQ